MVIKSLKTALNFAEDEQNNMKCIYGLRISITHI